MAYIDVDRVNRKLKLLEQQKHPIKQTNHVSTVITRGSANRDKKTSTTKTAPLTSTTKTTAPAVSIVPKASAVSKNIGAAVKQTTAAVTPAAVTSAPKVTDSALKAPAVSIFSGLTPKAAAPELSGQETKKTQKYDFEGYLSALEAAKAQEAQALNSHLNTQSLIEKGKEFFKNSGDLAAKQAEAQRFVSNSSANAVTNAAKKLGSNGAALLGAQVNANRTAANTASSVIGNYGRSVWDGYSQNASAYSRSLAQQGDATAKAAKNVYATYRDFGNNPDAPKMIAQTSGVTGSDQTVASFYGYQNDTRMKEPQKHWDVATLKEYRALNRTNKKDAERFAQSVNETYHKKQNEMRRKEQSDRIKQQIEDDYYAQLHAIGARAAAPMKGIDAYNSLLEYAATGKMSTAPNLSMGEYSRTVDDAISNRLERERGKTAAGIYRVGTEVFDGVTTYGVGGPTADILRSAGDSAFNALNRSRESGASDKQAAEYAFWNGLGSAGIDTGVGAMFDHIDFKDGKKLSKETKRNLWEDATTASLNSIIQEYKNKGFSDKHANHIAIYETMLKGGLNALADVTLSAAQRSFYEALQRAWRTGK